MKFLSYILIISHGMLAILSAGDTHADSFAPSKNDLDFHSLQAKINALFHFSPDAKAAKCPDADYYHYLLPSFDIAAYQQELFEEFRALSAMVETKRNESDDISYNSLIPLISHINENIIQRVNICTFKKNVSNQQLFDIFFRKPVLDEITRFDKIYILQYTTRGEGFSGYSFDCQKSLVLSPQSDKSGFSFDYIHHYVDEHYFYSDWYNELTDDYLAVLKEFIQTARDTSGTNKSYGSFERLYIIWIKDSGIKHIEYCYSYESINLDFITINPSSHMTRLIQEAQTDNETAGTDSEH